MSKQLLRHLDIDPEAAKIRCQRMPEGMPSDPLPDARRLSCGTNDPFRSMSGVKGCVPFLRIDGNRKSVSAGKGEIARQRSNSSATEA
jgi:hypothetical protein